MLFAGNFHGSPATFQLRGEAQFRMLAQQLLEKPQRSRIAGIRLRCPDKTLRCFGKLVLSLKRDSKVLEGVRALRIDPYRGATVSLAILEPAQCIQRESKVVMNQIPCSGVDRFHRKRLTIIADG